MCALKDAVDIGKGRERDYRQVCALKDTADLGGGGRERSKSRLEKSDKGAMPP